MCQCMNLFSHLENTSSKQVVLYAVLFFVLTRLLFLLAGFPFYYCFNMHLDEQLCKDNFLECLYYTHHKPPLFLLFLGLVYLLPATSFIPIYHAIYLLMGMIFTVTLFGVMDLFDIPRKWSVPLTALFMLGPSVIAYEHWLYYTYPCALMLCLSVLFLQLYFKYDKHGYLFAYFLLLAVLILTRSLFHLAWFMLFVLILAVYRRRFWKKILMAAALPFLLVLAFYVKNALLFGLFTTSSQAGFELSIMAMNQMPNEQREQLIREGKLSEFVAMGSHESVETYERFYPLKEAGIPILDQKVKSNGRVNYSHQIYLPVNRHFLEDSFYVLKHYPGYYLEALRYSTFRYLLPGPSKLGGEGRNARLMKRMSLYERVYNMIFLGQILPRTPCWTFRLNHSLYEVRASLFWLVGFPLLMVWIGIFLARILFGDDKHKKNFIPLLFMWLTTGYISFISIALNGNNRHRFLVESFVVIFVGLFLTSLGCRFAEGEDSARGN